MSRLAALRGALAFLTRLPAGSREGDWAAFRTTPAAFPVVGYVVGALAAVPLLAAGSVPAPTVALGYLLAVYLVTGIHHLDGVADVGDAVVVHGDADRRREVLKDTTTGVGALLAVTATVAGVALAGLGLAGLPIAVAVGVAVAAEVGAKVGMAAMACLASAGYEGMGSSVTGAVGPVAFVPAAAVAVPAAALTWPSPVGAVALAGALGGAAIPWLWARRRLGGVTGDVFGAANELGRLVGAHAGVIAWTLS
ncbi:adenosylcobinamide-GDP ribazoletransferase [Natrialbaceae archaeon AArc-T1-2]|uniref:adenosylcobinamide-GDP ribazoletransferase n=1 Tax=Natrialbaceae archaeon AArc-T1-2 TaxID=3053904 RepID=UPI00255AF34A|nr:adenosylcobinamide-GDP ribazoletransferase [Natrialbaceae archaeon AArc-T1-2]WIV65836.1 adenosylcobinamide-GDP ribazoletransferase [Natrialbaceae archaeon AArc-T1-2]